MDDFDVDQPAAVALRELQKLDEVTKIQPRERLIEAQDALGAELGLECTGAPEGDGWYDHSGDTCPIHEWLVPSDYNETESAVTT